VIVLHSPQQDVKSYYFWIPTGFWDCDAWITVVYSTPSHTHFLLQICSSAHLLSPTRLTRSLASSNLFLDMHDQAVRSSNRSCCGSPVLANHSAHAPKRLARCLPVRNRRLRCPCTASLPTAVEVGPLVSEPLPKPLPKALESVADDPTLHNPLQRMERFSPGWCGVIMELEGVVIQDNHDFVTAAWLKVAEEIGARRPLGYVLQKAQGVKDEVVSSFHPCTILLCRLGLAPPCEYFLNMLYPCQSIM
jgi:hypothetical protein